MSKVRTMQQVMTDSEEITFKKKDIDGKIEKLQNKIIELHGKNQELGGEKIFKNKQIEVYTEKFNNLKAERDTLKAKYTDLQKEMENMKKSNVKKVQQFTGLDSVLNIDNDEKGWEEVYKKKYEKKYDEWLKSLN
jgi:chromosome segregation ATPase